MTPISLYRWAAAVIEGVMMRAPGRIAICEAHSAAISSSNGKLHILRKNTKCSSSRHLGAVGLVR